MSEDSTGSTRLPEQSVTESIEDPRIGFDLNALSRSDENEPLSSQTADPQTDSGASSPQELRSERVDLGNIRNRSAHLKTSPEKDRKKSSVHPAEAVRRGLSFGPLVRTAVRHNSTAGILKSKSVSPPPSRNRRALSVSDTNEGRLDRDPSYGDDEDGSSESSEEDPQAWSSEEEGQLSGRGRKRVADVYDDPKIPTARTGSEESPAVMVTPPEGERTTSKRFVVHPSTNYDKPMSQTATPTESDTEELEEIRRAQRLAVNSSNIDSTVPHRVIQTLIRGDFAQLEQEARDGIRRLRTYVVATDLSEEAAFALEWTIGTVLRDGDTLLAIYAIDREVGTGISGDSLAIGEGERAMQDTTEVVEKLTLESQKAAQKAPKKTLSSGLAKAAFLPSSRRSSAANSSDSRAVSTAQQERLHAIQTLSETCIRFLRKTTLQARLAIEVVHCKSPRYLLTEAIDALKPTLVIIGSRGRSSLKGVLLGSFSNYLVTKSSSPVMVARKRLSKTKAPSPVVRLANNLNANKRIVDARID